MRSERFGSAILANRVFKRPPHMGQTRRGESAMSKESLMQKTEQVMALVTILTGERDEALKQLAITKAERDQMGAMMAQVESSVAETLDTTELAPEPTDKELAQELDDCRKALQAMKEELDKTKEDLARVEFKARSQAAKLKRMPLSGGGE